MTLPKLTQKDKIYLLERVVKWLTGADEIQYRLHGKYRDKELGRNSMHGYMTLTNTKPEDIEPKSYIDDGLDLEFTGAVRKSDFPWRRRDYPEIDAEIWFNDNPIEVVDSLRAKVKELQADKPDLEEHV